MFTYEEILERVKATVNGREFPSRENFIEFHSMRYVPEFQFHIVIDGFKIHNYGVSIQASENHYCMPRKNCSEYTHVEIGFPSFKFSDNFINKYADDPQNPLDTVYGYVPIEEVALEIYDFCKKEMKRLN